MGQGWRSQHELVACGVKVKVPFDKSKALGNVVDVPRTGNVWHDTEKPIDLLAAIIDVTNVATVVVDPFAGSGTTILAADRLSKPCRACELDKVHVAKALERCQLAGMDVAKQ